MLKRTFDVSKATLSLDTFNSMVGVVSKAAAEAPPKEKKDKAPPKKKEKRPPNVKDVQPPTSTRTNYKIVYADGRAEYVPDPPDWYESEEKKPGSETRRSSEMETIPVAPPQPKIVGEVRDLQEAVGNKTVSMSDTKTQVIEYADRLSRKMGKVSAEAGGKHKSALDRIRSTAREALKTVLNAFKSDSRKKMEEGVNQLGLSIDSMSDLDQLLAAEKKESSGNVDQAKKKEPAVNIEDRAKSLRKSGQKDGRSFIYEKSSLSTAPWEGKIEYIQAAITGEIEESVQASGDTINAVFFELSSDGKSRGVFKADGLGAPVSHARPVEDTGFNPKVESAAREVASFELDRLFGFGIVPPTFTKSSKRMTKREKAETAKRIFNKRTSMSDESKKKVLAAVASDELQGSTQQFMNDATPVSALKGSDGLENAAKKDKDLMFSVQKMAIFDYLTGASDRHTANMMLSNDGKSLYAIDNGLNFPMVNVLPEEDRINTTIDRKEDLAWFDSKPYAIYDRSVKIGSKGLPVSPEIVKQLKKVSSKDVKKIMSAQGMGKEADGVIARLAYIQKNGALPLVNNAALGREKMSRDESSVRRAAIERDLAIKAKQARIAEKQASVSDTINKERKFGRMSVDLVYVRPGKSHIVASFSFDGKKVVCTRGRDTELVEEIVTHGIQGDRGKWYFPHNGGTFMENLPIAFSGRVIRAVTKGEKI